jgi:hypothetical protein
LEAEAASEEIGLLNEKKSFQLLGLKFLNFCALLDGLPVIETLAAEAEAEPQERRDDPWIYLIPL